MRQCMMLFLAVLIFIGPGGRASEGGVTLELHEPLAVEPEDVVTERWGPVADFNRRFQVRRTDAAPLIDGNPDEAAWADAVVLRDFVTARRYHDLSLSHYASNRTEARVLFDEKGLYIAVTAWQDPATIYTDISKNDLLRPDLDWQTGAEPWANTGSDEIEIAIDPELTQASYYTFHVNPDGVMQKTWMEPARTWDGWNKRIDPVMVHDDQWRAEVSRDSDGWYAEIFIPFSSIGMREMEPSGPDDIFFDMVQDRTIMGFNINRIVHVEREASSWSPSYGAMFFRDAEHYGHAYFRQMDASLGRVVAPEVAVGETLVAAEIVPRSEETQAVSVAVEVAGEDYRFTAQRDLLLVPGSPETVTLDIELPPPGRYELDIRLFADDGYLMDRARYLFEVPPPIEVTVLKSILFEGERDLPVRVVLNEPHAHELDLRFRLVNGDEVVGQTDPAPAGPTAVERIFPFEVGSLAPGSYELVGELVGQGEVKAAASGTLRVIESPFELELSGTAGEPGEGLDADRPAGFEVLADTDGREVAPEAAALPEWLEEMAKERGFVVYAVPATHDFYPGGNVRSGGGAADAPRRAQLGLPLRAFAAGGEYEAVSFAVHALRDIDNPGVEFTLPRSAAGHVISEAHIDLRAERTDRYLVKADTLGGLPAGAARRYLLTVWVGEGTPAGLYEGTITVSNDDEVTERPYSLLVLPFALDDSPLTTGIYGNFFGNELDSVLAADLAAHGMDAFTNMNLLAPGQTTGARTRNIIWGIERPTGEGWLGDDPQRFSTELDVNIYRNIAEYGLGGPIVVDVSRFVRYVPTTPENAELFEQFVAKIEAMREEYDLPEFVYHLIDEPNNHYTFDDGRYGRRYGIQRVRFFGRVLREMGLRQYLTVNSTQRGYDIAEKAVEDADLWVPNHISDAAYVSKWLERGSEIWLYNYAGDGALKGAMRSTYGLYPLATGASGVTFWQYASFVRLMRAEGRVLSSSTWEAAREGVDDARYAATLAGAIERARSAGGNSARMAQRAAQDMEDILSAYPVETVAKVAFEERHDADDWNKWRWIMARWILALQGHI